jgi:chemotaxis protein MotB
MATFADMMSLLVCFFVLLLSFANMDIVKFRDMMGSMKDAFGVKVRGHGDLPAESSTLIELDFEEKEPTEPDLPETSQGQAQDRELLEQVERFAEERELTGIVEAVPGEGGVTVRVTGALMFETASDQLRPEAGPIFDELAELASRYAYKIAVEGHTDDVPISTDRFPSNWELSTARAVAGVRYLIERGNVSPERIGASGFAHTRPITRDTDPESKARNRRIEFVFYQDEEVGLDSPPGGPDLSGIHKVVQAAEEAPDLERSAEAEQRSHSIEQGQ